MKTESVPPPEHASPALPGASPELPWVLAMVRDSGPSTVTFIPGILCWHVLSSPTCTSRQGCSELELCRLPEALAPSAALLFPDNLEIARHRETPQVLCHSQKKIFPEGFNFLFSLFAELLHVYSHPGTFESKAQFVPKQTACEDSYLFLYLQQRTHYTKQFHF